MGVQIVGGFVGDGRDSDTCTLVNHPRMLGERYVVLKTSQLPSVEAARRQAGPLWSDPKRYGMTRTGQKLVQVLQHVTGLAELD
jgi:hypothetical protein